MNTKRALVTGASEGIGRVFAARLAKDGYRITAVARNEARLQTLVSELGPDGHAFMVADLSKPGDTDRIVAELTASHYDLLINNAGFGIYGRFHDIPLARHQEMVRLNCDALLTLSYAYLGTARSGDALINVASGLAYLPMAVAAVYSATKSFVATLSQTLWFEHKARGVYVMGLCPGVTSTLFNDRAGGAGQDSPPAAITQTPEQVVDKALRALKRRKSPIVYSGFINHVLITASRLMSRARLATLMGGMRPPPDQPK